MDLYENDAHDADPADGHADEERVEVSAGPFLVEICPEELPDDAQAMISILMSETASLFTWIDAAKAYLAIGKHQQYQDILSVLEGLTDADLRANYGHELETARGQADITFVRCQALCSLAQEKLEEMSATEDPTMRAQLSNEANKVLLRAEVLNRDEQMVEITKGLYFLAQDNVTAAKAAFSKAQSMLCNGRKCVAAHVALGQFYYSDKQYRMALSMYTEAVTAHPGAISNELRLAIGACHLKLNSYEQARRAFQRVLQLDSTSARAYAGLAAVELLSPERASVSTGLQLLQTAFELDPFFAPVCNALAQCNLVSGNLDAALTLAEQAVEHSIGKVSRAQGLCTQGRVRHAQNHLEDAFKLCERSVQQDPTPLAYYGMAQWVPRKDMVKNAMTFLGNSLEDAPANADALHLFGQLCIHSQAESPVADLPAKKLTQLKEGALKHAKNAAIQEVLGDVLALPDPAGSLKAYQSALALRREEDEKAAEDAAGEGSAAAPRSNLSAKLLNNAAVMLYRSGEAERARKLFEEGLQLMESGQERFLAPVSIPTLQYNLARCNEACGSLVTAEDSYQSILAAHPGYTSCQLRIGFLKLMQGHKQEAHTIFHKCLTMPGTEADAAAALCMMSQHKRDWGRAMTYAKKITEDKEQDKYSRSYAHVLAGNTHLLSAPDRDRDDSGRYDIKMARKRAEHLYAAGRQFTEALKLVPGNIYAANGLGAVCATLGNLPAASQIFNFLRESAASTSGFVQLPDVWVNLGSLHLAQDEPEDAARMYSAALAKFYNNQNSRIMLWQARALYDLKRIPQAKRVLLKALHICPADHTLLFNTALTMQQFATLILNRRKADKKMEPTVEEILCAKLELAHAVSYFQLLASLPESAFKAGHIKVKNMKAHQAFCYKTLEETDKLQKQAEHSEEARQKKVKELERKREIKESQEAAAQALAAAAEQEAAEMMRKRAQEFQEQVKAKNEKWKARAQELRAARKADKQASKSRKSADAMQADNDMFVADGFGESSDDSDYSESKMKEEQAEEQQREAELREAGYDSQDEAGLADVPGFSRDGVPAVATNGKHGRKRPHADTDAPEDADVHDEDIEDGVGGAASGGGSASKKARQVVMDPSDDEG